MKIVALLSVRNESLYLERCLRHLVSQGIDICIIDNNSTDDTRRIAERFKDKGVTHIIDFPYPGYYDWVGLLEFKQKLSNKINADWFIHHDGDEIRQAPQPYGTLREGIEAVNAAGYNAINFDEFVFMPGTEADAYEGTDYVQFMRYYYFFSPSPLHRVNAWKKAPDIDLSKSGGHIAEFKDRKIWPQNFILRHYIFLSVAHAQRKYGERIYSQEEIENRGWHQARVAWGGKRLMLPQPSQLKYISSPTELLDTSRPEQRHLFHFVDEDLIDG